ncbi:basement membrane-specific heparan sulfate proteoglycan core protein-like [Sinocyclocheilus rhinocerous]|uniref:basement membrane-specific heparan sulfate proteoglycan core protein-like n=1 Tax=Sinocyclocheilus rhinocerous TaxID=307959 RepID=UPI0007BA0565|nr:PREDICTED: basement membrane-specific heparan sulfate proteoglycan core protein-like [Sinocyclocheilus rhinocerous]
MLQTSERYTVNRDTLTIRGLNESDQDQYWCRGQRDERPKSSQESERINLSVNDSPRSTLTVTPDSPVFTGETVNLTCVIESYSNWRYEWYKGTDSVMLQMSERYTVNRDTLTIRGATESDQGQYWCRGQRDERPKSSQSSSVYLNVTDLPTSTLIVTPDSPVFTGETVNLTCVIESYSNWRYEWYKGGNNSVMLQTSERYTVNRDTLSIRGATESDQDQYWCRGQRYERPKSSQESERINLSDNARPKAVVKVTPDQRVFRGETVTLTCDIQGGGNIQWTYSWFKDVNTFYPYRTTRTAEFSFRADYVSYSGKYSCRGERSASQRSDISAAVTLTVSDLPRSTLTVTPDSPVFTGETVNLKCVIESHSNWRYEWYKGTDSVMLHPSERYTVNRDTLTIRGATESDQDQYTCRGQRDKRPKSSQSSSVSLSVMDSPRSTLTVTPDSPVFTGETVNLTCVIESYSNWRYEWYKGGNNSVMLQTSERYTVNRDTLTIRGATESDQDQYTCRGQRDERPKSSESSSVSFSVTDRSVNADMGQRSPD